MNPSNLKAHSVALENSITREGVFFDICSRIRCTSREAESLKVWVGPRALRTSVEYFLLQSLEEISPIAWCWASTPTSN